MSEVILQQTRVDQGLPYYHKFTEKFPSVRHLAEAEEDEVMKLWEGLGYYSRARNLHQAARQIVEENNERFPSSYRELLQLKGIGDYTAAAISSIAYNEAQPVVDGNVYRVLARYFGVDTPINTSAGKKEFRRLAEELLYRQDPGVFNQALMEFGALHCVPRNPHCASCVLKDDCRAFAEGRVDELPVKLRKKYNRQRFLNYAVLRVGDKIMVERRGEGDIWRKLYQFWLIETSEALNSAQAARKFYDELNGQAVITGALALPPHKLSHQSLHINIAELALTEIPAQHQAAEKLWLTEKELGNLAFPRPLRGFLDRNQLTLPLD